MTNRRSSAPDRALTILELVVVIALVVLLAAVALYSPCSVDGTVRVAAVHQHGTGAELHFPLSIESNGAGSLGGTQLNRSQIAVLFCDLHAAPIPMITFHSELPNPDESSRITDIRWNYERR